MVSNTFLGYLVYVYTVESDLEIVNICGFPFLTV